MAELIEVLSVALKCVAGGTLIWIVYCNIMRLIDNH